MRRAGRADAPAVLELWAEARSEHASTADRIDDVERLIGDSPAALLVAERDGEIVGVLIAAWDGWRGNMYRLAVRTGQRRQGIGLALTRAGEEYLRGCGARRITALVAFDDEQAERSGTPPATPATGTSVAGSATCSGAVAEFNRELDHHFEQRVPALPSSHHGLSSCVPVDQS